MEADGGESDGELAPYVPTKLSTRQKALTGEENADDGLQVLKFKCAPASWVRHLLHQG